MTISNTITLPIITVDADFNSVFKTMTLSLTEYNGMLISERQSALNFRHRVSASGYQSDWHVAGDPTLIVVQQGQLKLQTRNQQSQTFGAGEQFIAADYLPQHLDLEHTRGHRAEVISDMPFQAVHIKLSNKADEWLDLNKNFLTI